MILIQVAVVVLLVAVLFVCRPVFGLCLSYLSLPLSAAHQVPPCLSVCVCLFSCLLPLFSHIPQGPLQGVAKASPRRLRGGDVVGVSRCAVARDLAVDARPPRPRVLERLQNKHAPPFCHDEPGPVRVERSTGGLRAYDTHHTQTDRHRRNHTKHTEVHTGTHKYTTHTQHIHTERARRCAPCPQGEL